MWARAKNSCDEHQADNAGADMLKRARYGSWRRFAIQYEMTSPSRATVRVPAEGPYSRTAANTKVSEIEIEAGIDGSLTVAEPLIRVRAARRNHCGPTGVVVS